MSNRQNVPVIEDLNGRIIRSSQSTVEARLLHQDCLKALPKIRAHSIEAIVTDPPYNLGLFMKDRDTNLARMRENYFGAAGWDNDSESDWLNLMDSFFGEVVRVLKPGGAVIMFMSILKVEAIVRIATSHGLYYKTTGIWHKTNPMPRNMNLHFINSTEAWIYFTYRKRTGTFNNNGHALHDFFESSVASLSEKRFGKHPTQKPLSLMRYLLKATSNPGDTVLDPFMGSGSTGVAAVSLKRNFIGIDSDILYTQIAERRISEVIFGE